MTKPIESSLSSTALVRFFWVIAVLTTAWKIAAAARLNVSFDEGYYFYWSLFPQLSYFDHPPLAAWVMWLSGRVLPDSVWTIRFWPLVSGVLFAFIGRRLAREMFDEDGANVAGTLLLLAPVFLANGLIMTPDVLFALFWSCAVYCVWRALQQERFSGWWIATGLAAGAGALSKYNMILFYLSLGVLLLAAGDRRKRIFTGTSAAGLVSLAVFLPVLIWNAQRDWLSFRFQLTHGLSRAVSSPVKSFLDYAGSLFLIVSPFVALAVFIALLRKRTLFEFKRLFLGTFFVAPVLFFAWSSTKSHVEANWPMVAYFSGVILLSGDWNSLKVRWRRCIMGTLIVLDLAVMGYLLLPNDVALTVGSRQLDPRRMREFFGAEQVAAAVRETVRQRQPNFILVQSHQLFGTLAFYAPELRGKLFLPGKGQQRFPWIDDEKWRGTDALLVGYGEFRAETLELFTSAEFIDAIDIPIKKHRSRKIYLYAGHGYQSFSGTTEGPRHGEN